MEEEHGAVGVLVNNAGYSQTGAIETVPLDRVRAQFETNVFGLVRMCQLVLPGMRAQRWGKIVNVSSMGGRLTFPGGGHYHASKYAVEAISDALRFEVRGFGVDVIVVEPGFILTGFGEHARRRRGGATVRTRTSTPRSKTAYVETYEKGPLRHARRAARDGREADRQGDHGDPPPRPLHGHRVGQGADRPEGPPARRRLGRGHADDLPRTRPGLIHRSSRRGHRRTPAAGGRWHEYCRSRCPQPPPCAPRSCATRKRSRRCSARVSARTSGRRRRRRRTCARSGRRCARPAASTPGSPRARTGSRATPPRPARTSLVAVHPDATGRGLGGALRETAEQRARARGARVVRQFIPATNTEARVHLLEAGWWPVHHYFRMHIDLKDAPPRPDVLARIFDPDRDAEEVWHLVQGAYAGVEGHLPQSLESWRATGVEKPGWDPAFWLLQHDARGIVGAVLGERGGKGEARTGIITTVAVADRARGRGHGHTLVRLLLDEFRAARLRHAEASAHGPTAASARVFEVAGLHVARETERWEKVLGV